MELKKSRGETIEQIFQQPALSLAARAGLRHSDIITQINRTEIKTAERVQEVETINLGKIQQLAVNRNSLKAQLILKPEHLATTPR